MHDFSGGGGATLKFLGFWIYMPRSDMSRVFIEVWRKTCDKQRYSIGNVYRLLRYLSDDLASFTREFTDFLNIVRTRSKKIVYVCGYYNVDLLKIISNYDYCLFYENVLL